MLKNGRILFFSLLALLSSCHSSDKIAKLAIHSIKPSYDFTLDSVPRAPLYQNLENWMSIPKQNTELADVFYIHPTTYFIHSNWNQSLDQKSIKELTYHLVFANQASAFLEVANIYAPYYRQANFYAFLDLKKNGEKALDIAYEDVKNAFDYYIENFNQGRPFILASHSQGSYLGKKLLTYIQKNKVLKDRFICAYFVGWPVEDQYLASLPDIEMCQDSLSTRCINSWNTQRPFSLKSFAVKGIEVVNPLSWHNSNESIGKEKNLGGFFIENDLFTFSQKNLFHGDFDFPDDYEKHNDTIIIPHYIGAKTKRGVVLVKRPPNQKKLVMLLKAGNYHLYDYNFFYFNIRQNAKARINSYFDKKKADKK